MLKSNSGLKWWHCWDTIPTSHYEAFFTDHTDTTSFAWISDILQLKNVLTLKDRSRIYTGPTNAANRGSTHLRRTRAELVPHSPRSWPALEPRLCPIAGRCKPRFNGEVSELRLRQEPQAAFPVWVPQFQATGPRYTSRKSCVHTFMPYSSLPCLDRYNLIIWLLLCFREIWDNSRQPCKHSSNGRELDLFGWST